MDPVWQPSEPLDRLACLTIDRELDKATEAARLEIQEPLFAFKAVSLGLPPATREWTAARAFLERYRSGAAELVQAMASVLSETGAPWTPESVAWLTGLIGARLDGIGVSLQQAHNVKPANRVAKSINTIKAQIARDLQIELQKRLAAGQGRPGVHDARATTTIAREGIFFKGQIFDAFAAISSLVRTATSGVRLIDNYVDDSTLTMLGVRQNGIPIQVLTQSASAHFKTACALFKQQYGGLEVRACSAFHDRFMILDSDFYHFGASVKDAGKKAFMFSRVEEPVIIQAIEQAWKNAWATAEVIA